jgi:hypothetical protein
MAIVVQEERAYQVNWMGIMLWIAVIAMLGSVAYYVFFKNPELVGNVLTGATTADSDLAGVNPDPKPVQDNARFQALKNFPAPSSSAAVGRPNPFLSY